MTQDGVVLQTFPNGMAEVVVQRGTACGSNCGSCESCIYQSELKTMAINRIGAKAGQKVVLESKSSSIYKAELLIYIVPLLCLICGYLLAMALGASEGICILSAFALMILAVALIVITQRKKKAIPTVITNIRNQ